MTTAFCSPDRDPGVSLCVKIIIILMAARLKVSLDIILFCGSESKKSKFALNEFDALIDVQ